MSVRVSSWVWQHSPVEHRGDLLVLLVLADHAHDDGTSAYPSVETLSRKARLTRRGAQLSLRRLEGLGAIEAAGTGPRGVVAYRVLMSDGEAKSLRAEVTSREVSDPGGEVSVTGGANSPSPEPSNEPSREPPDSPSARPLSRRGPDVDVDVVDRLFRHWQERCTHTAAKFTPDRRRGITARLREGYTEEQIRQAIEGAARAPYTNDAGKRFDDIELVCRNGSKLESFMERADESSTARRRRAPTTDYDKYDRAAGL